MGSAASPARSTAAAGKAPGGRKLERGPRGRGRPAAPHAGSRPARPGPGRVLSRPFCCGGPRPAPAQASRPPFPSPHGLQTLGLSSPRTPGLLAPPQSPCFPEPPASPTSPWPGDPQTVRAPHPSARRGAPASLTPLPPRALAGAGGACPRRTRRRDRAVRPRSAPQPWGRRPANQQLRESAPRPGPGPGPSLTPTAAVPAGESGRRPGGAAADGPRSLPRLTPRAHSGPGPAAAAAAAGSRPRGRAASARAARARRPAEARPRPTPAAARARPRPCPELPPPGSTAHARRGPRMPSARPGSTHRARAGETPEPGCGRPRAWLRPRTAAPGEALAGGGSGTRPSGRPEAAALGRRS